MRVVIDTHVIVSALPISPAAHILAAYQRRTFELVYPLSFCKNMKKRSPRKRYAAIISSIHPRSLKPSVSWWLRPVSLRPQPLAW
jgi:hypothetical protein